MYLESLHSPSKLWECLMRFPMLRIVWYAHLLIYLFNLIWSSLKGLEPTHIREKDIQEIAHSWNACVRHRPDSVLLHKGQVPWGLSRPAPAAFPSAQRYVDCILPLRGWLQRTSSEITSSCPSQQPAWLFFVVCLSTLCFPLLHGK